jgi:hypothetical protein
MMEEGFKGAIQVHFGEIPKCENKLSSQFRARTAPEKTLHHTGMPTSLLADEASSLLEAGVLPLAD